MTKRRKGRRISWSKVLCVWLAGWGLWLIFAANLGWREVLIGWFAGGMGCFATMIVAHQEVARFEFRPWWLWEVFRVPWYVLVGTGQVLQGLVQQLLRARGADSQLLAVRFTVGGQTPRAAGRRALAVSFTTATPNFLIIGIVRKQKLLLYHQIVPARVPTMTRHLGARP